MAKKKTKTEDKNKVKELTELLKRTQADFINYKNRVEKETKQLMEYSDAAVIKELLPVLDSFEHALKNTEDSEKFKKGIELVYAQLMDILKQKGLSPIVSEGQFDPYKHEVLLKVKSDKPEGTILEVLQKGYQFKDKIIRHAKVKVAA